MSRLSVSFCIPTHGRPRLLLEALESGLTQTRPPDEVVVSDDMGNEETRTLVSEFAQRAPFPVRYVHCTTGHSQAENINHCLREATSDLILLLHDDDLLMPRCVELLARPFEENEKVVGAFGKQILISDAGQDLPRDTESNNRTYHREGAYAGLQPNGMLSGVWQQFPNDGFMVKAAIAREVGYRPERKAGTDFDFGIRMGERGMFYYVDEFTARYRISVNSVGRGVGAQSDDCSYQGMHILLQLLKTYPQYETEIMRKLRQIAPMAVNTALTMGKLKEASTWYFEPFHRHRIFTPGGIRVGLALAKAQLLEKFVHGS